jgi:hypothetical protein
MSAERHSLRGFFHDDPGSLQSIAEHDESREPAEGSGATPTRFVLARLIPSGPATAVAMPPTVFGRPVS